MPARPAEAMPYTSNEAIAAHVEAGRVATVLGDLSPGAAQEGEHVEVLVRPEAIKLLPPDEGRGSGRVPGRVVAAKFLGRSSLVHLSVADGEADDLHLHVRVPGRFLPDDGEIFPIDLDATQAFVFPVQAG